VLSVGSVAHLSATALDSAGNVIPATGIEYTALNPDIATVGSNGVITTLQQGLASFRASAGSKSAETYVSIQARDPVFHDFNDGTIGPYVNPTGLDLDFPLDPTGSGRGRVARFHYKGGFGDTGRELEWTFARRWAQPVYFKGQFYVAVSDLAANSVIRKLVYFLMHKNYGWYPGDGGLATGRTVVVLSGNSLVVDATYNPDPSTGKSSDDVRTVRNIAEGMQGNRWYTLEVYQRLESAIGLNDGVLQVRLDGVLLFDDNTMTWTDPAWVGDMKYGVPFPAADIYFEHFRVGDQVNWNEGSFDEYRYWDDVQFSSRPLSP
jgi:Big-like domain-containing protein